MLHLTRLGAITFFKDSINWKLTVHKKKKKTKVEKLKKWRLNTTSPIKEKKVQKDKKIDNILILSDDDEHIGEKRDLLPKKITKKICK